MVEIQYLLFNANHIGLKCPLIVWPGGGGGGIYNPPFISSHYIRGPPKWTYIIFRTKQYQKHQFPGLLEFRHMTK